MPILSQETSLHPPDLFERAQRGDAGRRWWAIYTKARQEKALARQLVGLNIPFFLPLIAQSRLIRGKRINSFVPLFDGYVFLFGTDDERRQSLTTNRISRILDVDSQDEFCRDLRAVRMLIGAHAPLSVERRLMSGDRVRVKDGALQGLEGTIVRRQGTDRLVVAVHYLQQGVSMEIDDYMLEEL